MRDWQFGVLIDDDRPLCRREADFLRWLDGNRARLCIEDTAAPGFDPALATDPPGLVAGSVIRRL
jgi:hypothetical protein